MRSATLASQPRIPSGDGMKTQPLSLISTDSHPGEPCIFNANSVDTHFRTMRRLWNPWAKRCGRVIQEPERVPSIGQCCNLRQLGAGAASCPLKRRTQKEGCRSLQGTQAKLLAACRSGPGEAEAMRSDLRPVKAATRISFGAEGSKATACPDAGAIWRQLQRRICSRSFQTD